MFLLILVHIIGGSIALGSGAVALAVHKGGVWHARAGTWFFGSMLVMTGTGAAVGALLPERGTALIGIISAYLVATAWHSARSRDGTAGTFELIGLLIALGATLTMIWLGVIGLNSPNGRVDSLPAGVHFGFAVLAGLAALFDLSVLLRRRLTGKQRIARHVWRICTALLIAALSFFLGQQDEFPAAWRGRFIWFLPPLTVFAAMLFWLVRLRFGAIFGKRTMQLARAIEPRQGAEIV